VEVNTIQVNAKLVLVTKMSDNVSVVTKIDTKFAHSRSHSSSSMAYGALVQTIVSVFVLALLNLGSKHFCTSFEVQSVSNEMTD